MKLACNFACREEEPSFSFLHSFLLQNPRRLSNVPVGRSYHRSFFLSRGTLQPMDWRVPMDGLYIKFQPANLNFFSSLFLFSSCCLYLGVNFSIKSDVGIFPRKSRILKILMKQNWLQQNYYLIIFTGSAKQHKAHIFIYLFIIFLNLSAPTALSYIETCQNFNRQDFKHHVKIACSP